LNAFLFFNSRAPVARHFVLFMMNTKTQIHSLKLAAVSALVIFGLVGCGSGVKLDDVPVSDRTGAPVTNPADAGVAPGTTNDGRGVPAVSIDAQGVAQPPASVGRVVYFDYDSFAVRPEFAAALEGHAKFLKADAKRRVVLEGHTDERGGREYNLALGQKRAEAVRRSLSILGVSDAQQEAVSFGKEKPAAMGADEAAFAKNRRVELTYR
jgi:peptidoglycan-associated lipoprotein